MSMWESLHLEAKVIELLDISSHDPDHYFGRPYLTPYQIALRFAERYSDDVASIGKPIGGKGTGQYDSLPQYIAHQLSRRIKEERDNPNFPIEGAFLSRLHLHALQYSHDGELVDSSSGQAYDLSMYRLRD